MSEGDPENNTFTVKDRRRFDGDGNPREPSETVTQGAYSGTPGGTPEAKTKPSEIESKPMPEQTRTGAESVDFSSFVLSLATQTLMLLGEVPAPEGVELKVDLPAAKQTIDILTMLKDKTKGNLDKEEEHLLEEVLHGLKMSFIKRSGL